MSSRSVNSIGCGPHSSSNSQAVLLIGEEPHPVDDLAQTLLEARRPCACMSPAVPEDAIAAPVLALDQAIRLLGLIAGHDVDDELAKQAHLDGESVDGVGRVGLSLRS